MRDKKLISKITGPEIRVPKFQQIFTNHYNLTKQQIAVLCILFLRGAQTVGEIKSRSYRIYEFENLAETESVLEELMRIENGPFIVKLPKDSGRENRFTHLFCEEPEIKSVQNILSSSDDRLTELEDQVALIKNMYTELKDEFEKFKKQFE